jgi:hypothetical protein
MNKLKITWKVAEAPSGRFRSFQDRAWPSATYADGQSALHITCVDDYRPKQVKLGQHAELSVNIAVYPETREAGKSAFEWKRLKAKFATLAEAKAGGENFLNAHPEVRAPGFRNIEEVK